MFHAGLSCSVTCGIVAGFSNRQPKSDKNFSNARRCMVGRKGYLMQTGRRSHSLILEANGKHVLTDSWTSFGVVAGLGLVMLTGWKPFDPLLAIAVAVNILWAGGHLVWRSAVGLLDHSDPEVGREIREKLDAICDELGLHYHGVRYRTTGYRQIIEVHLLFPHAMAVGGCASACDDAGRALVAELKCTSEYSLIWSHSKTTPPCMRQNTTPESQGKTDADPAW